MAAFAASRTMLMRNREDRTISIKKAAETKPSSDDKAIRKISTLTSGVSLTDKKFKTQRQGLSDGSNVPANHQHGGGFINKIRRESVSGKPKEPKKVPLVRQNSKVSFKPQGKKKVHFGEKKQFEVPAPKSVLGDHEFSPMDDHCPMVMVHKHMTRKPKTVRDIDEDGDPLKNPDYAQDIIDYLQVIEGRYSFPPKFLLDKKCQVKPKMRATLVDWLIQVQVHQNLSQDTLHLCIILTDRIMALQYISVNVLQLLGITSLLLAAKYHERFPPEISELCHLTDGSYKPSEVIKMEIYILKKLDFNINMPGPTVFVDRFLMINRCDEDSLIKNMSAFLLDLVLTEVEYVHIKPSMLAAGAIYVSREVFACETLWDEAYIHYTKYSESCLEPVIKLLRKCLGKLSKPQHQGAKIKYVHHTYEGISKHRAVLTAHELWPKTEDDVFDEEPIESFV